MVTPLGKARASMVFKAPQSTPVCSQDLDMLSAFILKGDHMINKEE